MKRTHITYRLGWLGGLLLILQALGLVLGEVHFAVVEHTVCAEHGEVVHADDHGDDEAHAAAVALEKEDDGEPSETDELRRAATQDEHAHDHCVVTQTRDEGEDTLAPQWLITSAIHALDATLPVVPTHWEAVPRAETQAYLLAPKNSPPLV